MTDKLEKQWMIAALDVNGGVVLDCRGEVIEDIMLLGVQRVNDDGIDGVEVNPAPLDRERPAILVWEGHFYIDEHGCEVGRGTWREATGDELRALHTAMDDSVQQEADPDDDMYCRRAQGNILSCPCGGQVIGERCQHGISAAHSVPTCKTFEEMSGKGEPEAILRYVRERMS